ncbi:MAG: TlpA family protein disulfide reductase [Bradymonadaceae bacterium]
MNPLRFRVVALVLAVAAAGTAAAEPWRRAPDPATVDAVAELDGQWVGRPTPSVTFEDLQGRRRTMADLRGHPVFLNFWGSFCKPCRREMPSLEQLARRFRNRGLVVAAASLDPKPEPLRAFLDRFLEGEQTAMEILRDPDGSAAGRFGTELLPETYIVDRRGRVLARLVNAYDWTRPAVRRLAKSLMQ